MKEVFWKSRYFKMTAALVILGMLAAVFGGKIWLKDKIMLPEDAHKALELEGNAEIVREFGLQTIGASVINGEKEWFGIRQYDTEDWSSVMRVEDREGNVLAESFFMDRGTVEQKAGDYAVLSGKPGEWAILNCNTLEFHETHLTNLQLNESGRYYRGRDESIPGRYLWMVYDTEKWGMLHESRHQLIFPEREGYVIENASDGPDRIVNLGTGEIVYTAPEGHHVKDGTDGMWLMSYEGVYYLLDDSFHMMLDGKVFADASVEDGMVFGHLITDWDYSHLLEETDGLVMSYKARASAFNSQGEQIYGAEAGIDYLGSIGNIMVLYDGQKECYIYEYMTADGVYETRTTEGFFCYMDEEDGYMLACTPYTNKSQRVRPKDDQIRLGIFPEDYKWSYVDLSLEPVLPFVFDEASLSENGYAVVYTQQDYMAIIDLMKRGEYL